MDLRAYYQKLRKIESEIQDEFPVVVSRETSDGGKAGLLTQVPRTLAARLIADGKSDLAEEKDAAGFLARSVEQWQAGLEESDSVKSRPARSGAKSPKKS